MRNSIILILFVIALVFAEDRPSNYFAASSSARGQQQQINNFAVWNTTSNSWINVIAPVFTGNVNGIVAVGTGLLAYGDFTAIGGRDAAGLAYYDSVEKLWCAPEGVGLYQFTPNNFTTAYNNTPAKSSAFAATVVGNDVYLYGAFNQIGLIRDGIAGLAKLTWSAGGIFSVSKLGTQGYNQRVANFPCTFCQRDVPQAQPGPGTKNKLLTHVVGGNTYFVFQDNNPGDLWQWQVDTPSWVKITNVNTARNITGAVKDFDLNSGNIYVVGKFDNTFDPVANNQYLHIACSTNLGNTWTAVAATNPLPVANFADLPAVANNITGVLLPALTSTGLFSIAVENTNSIYVAGGWRVAERNITLDNLAGQMQTRVIRISGTTYTLASERFAGDDFINPPDLTGPTIYRLVLSNSILYAFGDFKSYRQVVPTQSVRFGTRFTDVYKGAACLSNGVWAPAFGGFLTTSYQGDTSPATVFTAFTNNNVFFYGGIQSSYNILSGGVFAYGGDLNLNKKNRWNAVLQNQRFVSSLNYRNGISGEGTIYSIKVTKKKDVLIIGGQFDWIGSQRIGGIAAYNPVSDTVQQIGGGIYQTNNNNIYFGDSSYNNRAGGIVYDIEEWDNKLIIGGVFQRNNSGNCVSNIAWNKFRENGAGWEAIDGGCDNNVNDLLVVGSTLYITGDFRYCGLNPAGYQGGLYRGSIPTSRIARIDLSDKNRSWRNLGVGLDASGTALAWRDGDLFVGGSFNSAGGRIATSGIARWRGDHWEDVVARCRGDCGRPVNVLPYIGTNEVPGSNERKPGNCLNLRSFNGRIYCIDTNNARLAYFTSDTWYQAADISTFVSGKQNSLIMVNQTNQEFIIVSSTNTNGANGANYAAYDANHIQYAPSHGGFSLAPFGFADTVN